MRDHKIRIVISVLYIFSLHFKETRFSSMYYLEDFVQVGIIIYERSLHFSVASVMQSEKGKLK